MLVSKLENFLPKMLIYEIFAMEMDEDSSLYGADAVSAA